MTTDLRALLQAALTDYDENAYARDDEPIWISHARAALAEKAPEPVWCSITDKSVVWIEDEETGEVIATGLTPENASRILRAINDAPPPASPEPTSLYRCHPQDLYDFMGWLTTRKERLMLSAIDNAAPAAEAVGEYLRLHPEIEQGVLASPEPTQEQLGEAFERIKPILATMPNAPKQTSPDDARDAARYRWVRAQALWAPDFHGKIRWDFFLQMKEPDVSKEALEHDDSVKLELDAAIDAAIEREGGAK
jgi:hypothetical protein